MPEIKGEEISERGRREEGRGREFVFFSMIILQKTKM